MVTKDSNIYFKEVQQFRQLWLWVIMFVVELALIVALIISSQSSSSGWGVIVITTLFFSGLCYLFYVLKLTTKVQEDGLHVGFRLAPGQNKIEFKSINTCVARNYQPIKEYGGWGIRYGKNGKAYNVSGNQGVQLELEQGKRLLIGSKRAEELAKAIKSKM